MSRFGTGQDDSSVCATLSIGGAYHGVALIVEAVMTMPMSPKLL